MPWIEICRPEDIPRLGSRVVRTNDREIGMFRTEDDRFFAINNLCPHKKGPLSAGDIDGDHVICPLHDWKISLETGYADAPNEGETTCYPTKIENGVLFLEI